MTASRRPAREAIICLEIKIASPPEADRNDEKKELAITGSKGRSASKKHMQSKT